MYTKFGNLKIMLQLCAVEIKDKTKKNDKKH
jgi:hypothetical protein